MNYVTEKTFANYRDCRDEKDLLWQSVSSSEALKTPIFNVNLVERTSNEGQKGEFVELKAPYSVNVIPYFRGSDGIDRFVMVRQFRHGSETVTTEFPAGLVEPEENPDDAVLRELEEETGIKAHRLKRIGVMNPNSAFMNTKSYFYLAEELEYTGKRHLDDTEQINTVSVRCDELIEKAGTESFTNSAMLSSLFFFLREKGLINK